MGDKEMDIIIDPDGTIRFIYTDELAAVFEGEDQRTVRASHVEPAETFGWEADGWVADMRPSGGPLLYDGVIGPTKVKQPFKTRQAALDAELAWLRKERGL